MRELVPRIILVQLTLLLLDIYVPESMSSSYGSEYSIQSKRFISSQYVSSSTHLQPLAPQWAPSPLMPFTYDSLPKLSDVEKILESQGSNGNLSKICSIGPSNITRASCPIIEVDKVDSILASTSLLATCNKIDIADECCNRICQDAISAAAGKLALTNYSMKTLSGSLVLPDDSAITRDCTNIVLRWVASKFDPSSGKRLLRGLSSCKLNKACPLVFPDINEMSKECGGQLDNRTSCCNAIESYMSHLQEQSFITNLQAINCASLLAKKLQSANISSNVYNLCHINLKEFSPQVDSKESGCLFPSLPSDVTFDKSSGIGFICDLNDNVVAPWPTGPFVSASSCNKDSILPEIPTATSSQIGRSTC